VDCDFSDGQTLTPEKIQDHAHLLWNQSGDSQETVAAGIGRSQAAVSKALRAGKSPETRYVRICIDMIEHYCEGVKIQYPKGQVTVEQ
jgi:predicted transcriptional regulator